jgi:tetratricopeptide (TPR) repeat protein
MKKLLFIIISVLSFNLSLNANEIFKKAEAAYDSKKYTEAIKNYEQLVAEGYISYQLYFNLGNSYYRNNQLGKAIYYYELARKLAPNDEDVKINLGIAASKTIDKIDSKENFFISAVKTSLLSSFSTNIWAWMSIVSLVLAAVLFYVFVDSSVLVIKRFSFLFSCVFVVSFILTYFLGYTALKARFENKFAIVVSKEVRVMNEPTAMAKTKFSLHEGTKIRVVSTNGDWVLIKLDNGNEGWLKLGDVGVI